MKALKYLSRRHDLVELILLVMVSFAIFAILVFGPEAFA